jgi:hypothetical protein
MNNSRKKIQRLLIEISNLNVDLQIEKESVLKLEEENLQQSQQIETQQLKIQDLQIENSKINVELQFEKLKSQIYQ